jgi:DNA polymerase III delta prime subunit
MFHNASMHAYLLIANNDEHIKERAISLAGSHLARLVPFELQKIADVRELSKLTRLTLSKTAFFVEHIDETTPDALNAFLKQLEEPGENITYILTARSEDKVLPTIVSRCQVMRVKNQESGIMNQARNKNPFFAQSIGQQFAQLDKIKKREEAIEFIQNMINELHEELIDIDNHSTNLSLISSRLSLSQQTLTALLKNGNVTSQLTRFIVKLNKI